MIDRSVAGFLAALALMASPALGEAPDLKTPTPVIYLSDNLNEPDDLGWCIDTLGRGFAEKLQAHSCKPQGGDVQFGHDPSTGSIYSVAFEGKCMERLPDGSEVTFGLVDCDPSRPAQRFAFDPSAGTITPTDAPDLCVAVGADYRQAGPFSSRDLLLSPCAQTDPVRVHWTYREG